MLPVPGLRRFVLHERTGASPQWRDDRQRLDASPFSANSAAFQSGRTSMRLLFPLVASLAIVACSDAERDAAADADGNGSMNAATAAAADTGGPSTIDCARASGQAEQAVCADKE